MPSLTDLLEYASQRLADGTHLAEIVLNDHAHGSSPDEVATACAARGAFLTAYFADCLHRLTDPEEGI